MKLDTASTDNQAIYRVKEPNWMSTHRATSLSTLSQIEIWHEFFEAGTINKLSQVITNLTAKVVCS